MVGPLQSIQSECFFFFVVLVWYGAPKTRSSKRKQLLHPIHLATVEKWGKLNTFPTQNDIRRDWLLFVSCFYSISFNFLGQSSVTMLQPIREVNRKLKSNFFFLVCKDVHPAYYVLRLTILFCAIHCWDNFEIIGLSAATMWTLEVEN